MKRHPALAGVCVFLAFAAFYTTAALIMLKVSGH